MSSKNKKIDKRLDKDVVDQKKSSVQSKNKTAKKTTKAKSTSLVSQDPLQKYINEIKNIPTLSREEEKELALKFEQGDESAGYKLVVSNLRLVVKIAREYHKNLHTILDLIQEGNLGLLEAVNKFDPYKEVRFPSYAVYWVRAYMLRYLINNMRLVKIGTTQAQRKLFYNLNKEKDKLEAEGFFPEAKLLAERLNVKESEVVEMEQRLSLPDLSVDSKIKNDSDSHATYHSVLSDDSASVEDEIVGEDFKKKIREVIEQFKEGVSERDKAIIEFRLFSNEPKTLQQIAEEFSLSRERIRQRETELKKELKDHLEEKLNISSSFFMD